METAWQKVLQEWDDDAAHKQFLVLCSTTGQLAEAGKRYRKVRDEEPERSEAAAKRIDAVLGMAMQNMDIIRSPEPKGRSWTFWAAALVSGGLILFALTLVLRVR